MQARTPPPGVTLKGEDTFTQTTYDGPLDAGTKYTLSYNSSGSSVKASGGFTLYGVDGSFLGGKTIALCQDLQAGISSIINSVNPPKKTDVREADYLVINIDATGKETVDAVVGSQPTCKLLGY